MFCLNFVMEQKRLFFIVSAYLYSMFVAVGTQTQTEGKIPLVRISENLRFYQRIPAKSIAYLSRFGIIKEWFKYQWSSTLKTCLMNLEEIHVTSSSHKK